LAGGRKYTSSTNSGGRRSVVSYSRSYDRSYDQEPRSYGRSRSYTRAASYDRGYAPSYYGRGNSDYSNGYATIYR
jgi:hypothetical protein